MGPCGLNSIRSSSRVVEQERSSYKHLCLPSVYISPNLCTLCGATPCFLFFPFLNLSANFCEYTSFLEHFIVMKGSKKENCEGYAISGEEPSARITLVVVPTAPTASLLSFLNLITCLPCSFSSFHLDIIVHLNIVTQFDSSGPSLSVVSSGDR